MADPPFLHQAGDGESKKAASGQLGEKGSYTNRCETPALSQTKSPEALKTVNYGSDYIPTHSIGKQSKAVQQSPLIPKTPAADDNYDSIPDLIIQTRDLKLDRINLQPCGTSPSKYEFEDEY